jgi:orotidine-5'-phosphate decarboxylase
MNDRVIVALDVPTGERAKRLVDDLCPLIKLFKVGSLYNICGSEIIEYIYKKGGRVFLDSKWYDIENTVYNYVSATTGSSCMVDTFTVDDAQGMGDSAIACAVFMMSVHIEGEKDMLQAAMRGAKDKADELKIERPKIVGITVLTNKTYDNVEEEVLKRAKIAQDAGLDGVVCSAHEAAAVRKACGNNFVIVTPGIRPKNTKADDQKRVATAQEAFQAGADYIVVGRPIIVAKNPLEAAKALI